MCREATGYRVAKRLLDLGLSAVGMVVLAPLLGVIVLAIRLESRGAAFRTMDIDSPTFSPKPTSFDDERITRLGRFLRRSSLDELPQLVNVLKGEMSLVGPRPEQPFLVERYEDWQRQRLAVPPGMTGWWQVNGRKQPMHDYVEEDLYYIKHRSFLFDLRILLRTINAVARADGSL